LANVVRVVFWVNNWVTYDMPCDFMRISHQRRFIIRIKTLWHKVKLIFFSSSFTILPEPEGILLVKRIKITSLNYLSFSEFRIDMRTEFILDYDWYKLFLIGH
jgi:hypothetical protein